MKLRTKKILLGLTIIPVAILLIIIITVKNHNVPESIKGTIIHESLESLSAYGIHPPLPNPAETEKAWVIFLRDSIIYKGNIPKLPDVKYVCLNSNSIADSVLKNGHFEYFKLLKMDKSSDTVNVIWRKMYGIYSHKLNKINYQANEDIEIKLRRTSEGWTGGISRVLFYTNLGVK